MRLYEGDYVVWIDNRNDDIGRILRLNGSQYYLIRWHFSGRETDTRTTEVRRAKL